MIDWARVGELRDEIGAEGFSEVVDLFLEEVEDAIGRLCARPVPGALESDLHFLKGCAWNLGLTAFGAICHEGERQSRNPAGAVDMAAVIEGYSHSSAAFLAGLAERQWFGWARDASDAA